MNSIELYFNHNYGKPYLKTIFACSCSLKKTNLCKDCHSNRLCDLVDDDNKGFVICDNYIYDFDSISTKINGNTSSQSVDSIIIHNGNSISLIEFTNGNPYNKRPFKKCLDSINTLLVVDKNLNSKSIIDFYFVYNSCKLNYDHYSNYKQIMYEDFFLGFIDLNGTKDILIRYFNLSKLYDYCNSVYALNEKEFLDVVDSSDRWMVYNKLL